MLAPQESDQSTEYASEAFSTPSSHSMLLTRPLYKESGKGNYDGGGRRKWDVSEMHSMTFMCRNENICNKTPQTRWEFSRKDNSDPSVVIRTSITHAAQGRRSSRSRANRWIRAHWLVFVGEIGTNREGERRALNVEPLMACGVSHLLASNEIPVIRTTRSRMPMVT